jgi:hypothetical protein
MSALQRLAADSVRVSSTVCSSRRWRQYPFGEALGEDLAPA